MSAHAYIQYADVPQPLIDSSSQHVDSITGAKVISFIGCTLCGQIDVLSDGRIQIEFPWPHALELRHSLGDWLSYHSIPYAVVP